MMAELHTDLRHVVADLCADSPDGSPRWWLALIMQLPLHGAFFAAVQGGAEFRGWTIQAYIDSYIYDSTQWLMLKGSKKRKIEEFPRPGANKKKRRVATLEEALPY